MIENYHINIKTGNVNICRAKLGNCPLKDNDGKPAQHFENKQYASTYNERELRKTHKPLSSVQKPRKTLLRTLTEEENIRLTEEMIEEYDEMVKHLTKKEQRSLRYYSFSGSSAMNRILHGTTREYETEDSIEKDKAHIQRIDEIIKKFGNNSETKTLYRYVSLDKKSNVNEYMRDNFQEGNEYADTGFMSTTEDLAFIAAYAKKHSRNRDFIILEIETNKGISMQSSQESIGRIQTFEKERLLPRDMRFKVQEKFKSRIKIDESRQKLTKQFNGSSYSNGWGSEEVANHIPAKTFQIIKLIDES